jgi:pimeloyl-ACP methyl ester carboxylesterase
MNPTLTHFLSTLFPGAIAAFAYRQLTNPQLRKLRAHELEVMQTAVQEDLDFQGFRIRTYRWEGEKETILLVHGWEGQAGNFADLIERLQSEGYGILAFDGPSHGFSSRGKTSLFEFAELVGFLAKSSGVKKIVSHSFGGVATVLGLSQQPEVAIEKYVLLTTPDRFIDRIEQVAQQTGITEKVKQKLIQRLESETPLPVDELNVSAFVSKLQVEKSLIIHDKDDRIVPISQSQNVCNNWPVCTLQAIEGTGHFRILRTDFVLDQVITFLA